jgi:hypothetical protein
MLSAFHDVKRVLASVGALALLALNEVRMFYMLPNAADPGNGRTHALSLQLFGDFQTVYASVLDLAVRWGIFGLILAACVWAVAETLQPAAQAKNIAKRP